MPLTDEEYQRWASYILAAARAHPDDCLVTIDQVARALRENDHIRGLFQELRTWAANERAGG